MEVDNDDARVRTGHGQGGASGPHMALRERPRRRERRIQMLQSKEFHFLDDFDPEKSNRERRKMSRKMTAQVRTVYNEYGHIRHNDLDICDCMDENCLGCWYECENCGSTKCGVHCRVNRKFCFETIAFDGKDGQIMNPHAPPGKLNNKQNYKE